MVVTTMMRRARLILVSLLAITAVAPAPAPAADTVLAPATATAGLTAHDGHVVLSRLDPQTGRWALVRWHAGVVDVLPVAQRSVPFDADAGSDRAGNPVVVYSRCTTEPPLDRVGLAPAPDWQTARGCDLYELALTGALAERKLTPASSRGASETTPSIWRGALAFARHADGGSLPSILFLAAGSRRPRRLGGGSVQTCSAPGYCGVDRRHDGIDQLDLGPSRAAYVWRMTGGAVYGTGIVWELRAAPTAGGRSILLDSGLISGTCGFRLPSAPSASSSPIAYLAAGATCDVATTSFATADPVTGDNAQAATQGGLAAAPSYAHTIYWRGRRAARRGRGPSPARVTCRSHVTTAWAEDSAAGPASSRRSTRRDRCLRARAARPHDEPPPRQLLRGEEPGRPRRAHRRRGARRPVRGRGATFTSRSPTSRRAADRVRSTAAAERTRRRLGPQADLPVRAMQERDEVRACPARQLAEALHRRGGLAAVPEDRLLEVAGAPVVQEPRVTVDDLGQADAPQRRRAPFRA